MQTGLEQPECVLSIPNICSAGCRHPSNDPPRKLGRRRLEISTCVFRSGAGLTDMFRANQHPSHGECPKREQPDELSLSRSGRLGPR